MYAINVDFSDKVVVVGESSGIGLNLSKAFYEEGANVVATHTINVKLVQKTKIDGINIIVI
ncbi:MAG: hypothetical protein LBH37_03830 [Oscillospiraceae bacterium]|nr:hypothetical protein [Oscillospiraceae bacterium]